MNVNQLTETIQAYYDRNGINEKADVVVNEVNPGALKIEVHTNKLLTYIHLVHVSSIVWALMPMGVTHEVINVVLDVQHKEQKITTDGFEMKNVVEPANALPDPSTSVTMPGVNEAGEIVPMPVPRNKKKCNKNNLPEGPILPDDIIYEGL
jgi:hypothetical protein